MTDGLHFYAYLNICLSKSFFYFLKYILLIMLLTVVTFFLPFIPLHPAAPLPPAISFKFLVLPLLLLAPL